MTSARFVISFFFRPAQQSVNFGALCLAAALPLLGVTGCNDDLRLASAGTSGTAAGSTTTTGASISAQASSAGNSSAQTPKAAARWATMSLEQSDPSSSCVGFYVTSPRGVSCLHCTQPEAEEQSHVLIDILQRSCLKNVALNYLVDGTFSSRLDPIYDHVDRLARSGRQVFLEFYLLNGPKQRRAAKDSILRPELFRREIFTNAELRAAYQRRVTRLIPLLHYAQSRGAVISIVPMLEDNLTDEAFEELLNLTVEVLPADVTVALGRNACPSCYSGNESAVPAGLFEEIHTTSPRGDLQGGIVTNDGSDVDEIESLATLRDWADKRDSTFILWDAERQGFIKRGNTLVRPPTVAERDYVIPDDADQTSIASFLRGK